MIKKGSIEYNGVWGFRDKFFTLEGACVTDWEATGEQLLSHDIMYDEVQWVDPEPWRGECFWFLKEARVTARMLINRLDVWGVRLIAFTRNEEGVVTIQDIVEIETHYDRDSYKYGSGVDRFLKEWCGDNVLFSFEIVIEGYYDGK